MLCAQIKAGLENNAGSETPARKDTVALAAETVKLCEHMSSDLSTVRDTMTEAVSSISANLNDISLHATNMSEQARTITASSKIRGHSFFEEIGNSLDTISSSLYRVLKADMEVSNNAVTVSRFIEQISTEVNGIEQISDDVNLVALNARVKSSQFGHSGSTIKILAQASLSLSAKSETITAVTAEALSTIKSKVEILSAELTHEIEKTRDEANRIEQEMQSLVEIFRDLNDRVNGLLEVLDTEVLSLSDNISMTVSEIGSHDDIAAPIKDAIKELDAMAQEGKRVLQDTICFDNAVIVDQVKIGQSGSSTNNNSNSELIKMGQTINSMGNNVEIF